MKTTGNGKRRSRPQLDVRSLALVTVLTLFGVGCSRRSETEHFETNFLNVTCGSWRDTTTISDLSGGRAVNGTLEFVLNHEPDKNRYVATGKVLDSPKGSYGLRREYTLVSASKAKWTYTDELGTKAEGELLQVANDRCEEKGYGENGKLSMKAIITFSADEMKTTMTYFDSSGRPYLKGESVSIRQRNRAK